MICETVQIKDPSNWQRNPPSTRTDGCRIFTIEYPDPDLDYRRQEPFYALRNPIPTSLKISTLLTDTIITKPVESKEGYYTSFTFTVEQFIKIDAVNYPDPIRENLCKILKTVSRVHFVAECKFSQNELHMFIKHLSPQHPKFKMLFSGPGIKRLPSVESLSKFHIHRLNAELSAQRAREFAPLISAQYKKLDLKIAHQGEEQSTFVLTADDSKTGLKLRNFAPLQSTDSQHLFSALPPILDRVSLDNKSMQFVVSGKKVKDLILQGSWDKDAFKLISDHLGDHIQALDMRKCTTQPSFAGCQFPALQTAFMHPSCSSQDLKDLDAVAGRTITALALDECEEDTHIEKHLFANLKTFQSLRSSLKSADIKNLSKSLEVMSITQSDITVTKKDFPNLKHVKGSVKIKTKKGCCI